MKTKYILAALVILFIAIVLIVAIQVRDRPERTPEDAPTEVVTGAPEGTETPAPPPLAEPLEPQLPVTAEVPREGAVIEGTVTAADGRNLPSAWVLLHEWLPPQPRPFLDLIFTPAPRTGDVLAETICNASGEFAIDGLRPGNYMVSALTEGFAQNGQEVLQLRRDERRSGIEITLYPAAAITGEVVDEAQRPIQGAIIEPVRRGNPIVPGAPEWVNYPAARSDEDGAFTADNLLPGFYDLEVRCAGYAPTLVESVKTEGDPVTVILKRGITVRGEVVDNGERPVPGAFVQAFEIIPGKQSEPLFEEEIVTNRFGLFALADLAEPAEGADILVASFAPGFQVTTWLLSSAPPGKPDVEITLQLKPGAEVRGVVLDEDRRPVASASVEVIRAWKKAGTPVRQVNNPWVTFESNRSGQFEVFGLPPGRAELKFSKSGYAPQYLSSVEVPSATLEVILSKGGAIVGRVVSQDDHSRGVPRASVFANPLSTGGGAQSLMDRKVAVSREDGQFTLENLASGEYELRASLGAIPGPDKANVEVPAGGVALGVQLTVRQAGRISGQVVDSDGHPVPSAKVWAQGRQGRRTTTTDANGYFFMEGLGQGQWEIGARKEGYTPLLLGNPNAPVVELGLGEDRDNVLVRLTRGALLSGRVVNHENKPVSRAYVYTSSLDGQVNGGQNEERFPSVSTVTDREGYFILDSISPRFDFNLIVNHPDYPVYESERMSLSEGQRQQTGVIQLRQTGRLSGRLRDSEGGPVQGKVELAGQEDFASPDGAFRLQRVPVGAHTLKASAEGYETKSLSVDVVPGDEQEPLEISLERINERE